MQRHLRGEPEQFGCLAGWKFFFLDWQRDLYRCHNWKEPMCHITQCDRSSRVRDNCTACMIDCHRDDSVMQHIGVAVSDGVQAVARGRFREACKHWFNRKKSRFLEGGGARRRGLAAYHRYELRDSLRGVVLPLLAPSEASSMEPEIRPRVRRPPRHPRARVARCSRNPRRRVGKRGAGRAPAAVHRRRAPMIRRHGVFRGPDQWRRGWDSTQVRASTSTRSMARSAIFLRDEQVCVTLLGEVIHR